jgi:hypothetical protein
VEEVAVAGTLITGKARGQFFLLDTAQVNPKPDFFSTNAGWTNALKTSGASPPTQLATPDSIAAKLSTNTLRPWQFRIMGGRLGLSDEGWSLAVQVCGLLLAFIFGLLFSRRSARLPAAIALGILINIVAQIFLAGGGPGAFVGFLFLPFVFALMAAFGTLVRRGFRRKSRTAA